jgi:hypothetical protein
MRSPIELQGVLALKLSPGAKREDPPSDAHDEVALLFREGENRWMTTRETARVNNARTYRKKDGTSVTPFPVRGRTTNDTKLFKRDGYRVQLLTSLSMGDKLRTARSGEGSRAAGLED